MVGFPVNVHNATNIAICHLVRLGLPMAPHLSFKGDFIRVMLATRVNYDDLHSDKYDDRHSQGVIDA
jgi:hypothetical protein